MRARAAMVVLWATLGAGCLAGADGECRLSRECEEAMVCIRARCVPEWETLEPVPQEPGAPEPDRGAGLDLGAGLSVEPLDVGPAPGCEGARLPAAGELVINEVLAHVPTGSEGDASGDGVRDAYGDEFVELVNLGTARLTLSGGRVVVGEDPRATLPPLCLEAGEALVIFGGPPAGALGPPVVGVRRLHLEGERLALRNEGGRVRLVGQAGQEWARADWGPSGGRSIIRDPELVGEAWAAHPGPDRFSPGRCADGGALAAGCGPAGPPQGAQDMGEGEVGDR